MVEYLWLVKQTIDHFQNVRVVYVAQGTELACRLFKHIGVTINRGNSSINQSGVVAELSTNAGVGVSLVMTIEPCWMDPIIDFLAEDRILADENEIEKVH